MSEKIAIVTAGGSGMGAAAARRLAQDGFRVAILSSSGKGETLAKELGGLGVTGCFIRMGSAVVMLLCGGTKSSQEGDIRQAKALARELEC